ncbi:MAG: alpha/beta hydrolase [Alphaproteobacteria bacterium]|nr:alpha/beta hydrolase [Alphaproteobacteria bacterium]
MGQSIRPILIVLCAIVLSGCVSPSNFDVGAKSIRTLNVSTATQKVVNFVTTRCNDPLNAGAPGSAEELYRKRCWDAAHGNAEILRLGYGMADSGTVKCGTAVISVVPKDAPTDATTAIGQPFTTECAGFEPLRRAIAATPCRCALIFVHGYYTTFGYGLRRAAQLALDVDYPGVVILFSFAAGGRYNDYVNDIEASEAATPALHQLLATLSRSDELGPPNIDVVGHSLGNQALLRAIDTGEAPTLRYVVTAAPDVDAAYFVRLIGQAAPHTKRLTVYTAKYDVALAASNTAHGNWPRAGQGLSPTVVQAIPKAELVNATDHASDPYAHSYFAESKSVLDDVKLALQGFDGAHRPPLICEPSGLATVCRIPCADDDNCGPTFFQRLIHWLFD